MIEASALSGLGALSANADAQNWTYGQRLGWAPYVRAASSLLEPPYLSVVPSEDGGSSAFPLMLDQAGFAKAVAAYQQWRGIGSDGILGSGTWTRMLQDYGDRFTTAQVQQFRSKLGTGSGATPPASSPPVEASGTPWGTYLAVGLGLVVVGGLAYAAQPMDGLGSAPAHWRPGDVANWMGKRVLVVDVHGYPTQTVDLRWTESGTSGGRDEVSGHKRGVPAGQLEPFKPGLGMCKRGRR